MAELRCLVMPSKCVMRMRSDLYTLSKTQIGPVLCDYVYWVLQEARRQEVSTLYFLARDGYVLQRIAQEICMTEKISIECRYLYCSRASLRMPSYHLIGDEAYDLLFQGGYHVSIHSFFERAMIEEKYWETILEQCGIARNIDLDRELQQSELKKFRKLFMQSETFSSLLKENSQNAYESTIGYFTQEGLFRQKHIGIVDSGWIGSMQRSLRQLLQSKGYRGKLTGFYFGMYTDGKEPADGQYFSWYFSKKQGKKNKILFCNNLFECILSAPHGMTIGYKKENCVYKPVLKEAPKSEQMKEIQTQILGLIDGAKMRIRNGMTVRRTNSEKTLHHLMGHPEKEIVKLYGKFLFCDDITEDYHYPLADDAQGALKGYIVWNRFIRKIFSISTKKLSRELFWPYGTVAFVKNPIKRAWYWVNIYLWEWAKFALK